MGGEAMGFAAVLDQALRDRKLPLERIAAKLTEANTPVSTASLSYWRSGQRRPTKPSSLQAVAQLEHILATPPGALLTALDVHDWTLLSSHDWYRIGDAEPDGVAIDMTTRLVVRAERGQLSRLPAPVVTPEAMNVSALIGCQIAQPNPTNPRDVHLLLNPPLRPGEVRLLEFATSWHQPQPVVLRREIPAGLPEYIIHLEFAYPPARLKTTWLAAGHLVCQHTGDAPSVVDLASPPDVDILEMTW